MGRGEQFKGQDGLTNVTLKFLMLLGTTYTDSDLDLTERFKAKLEWPVFLESWLKPHLFQYSERADSHGPALSKA